jgi:DNA-binding LacI/PurR family transcriptional regulator
MTVTGIKEVAARAGVSVGTASRALSGNGSVAAGTRKRVLTAAQELNFVRSYNASSLVTGRSRIIGVIVPSVDRWYFAKVVAGIAEELITVGYDLALYNIFGDRDHQDAVLEDFLMRQRLDAVLPVSLELTPEELTRILSIRRPIVGIGGPMPGVPTIGMDHFAAGSLATAHLLGLGHERIAHISGGIDPYRDFKLTDQRQTGFENEMKKAGATVRPEWIIASDFTLQDAYQKARSLLAMPERPTAVFAASDEMAIGVILAARDLGLQVPYDLSVVGIDGHELGETFGLTTIQQFPRQQGQQAARKLLQKLSKKAVAFDEGNETGGRDMPTTGGSLPPDNLHELLDTKFLVRHSTAVPRSRAQDLERQ